MKKLLILVFSLFCLSAAAQELRKDISVHDPVMIKAKDTYYIFCTGMGISVWSSKDRVNWKAEEPVFSDAPAWTAKAVPGFKKHFWAPDISYWNGWYYLYYSISAFGKNTSAIGLVTNKTLDPLSADFKWEDQGKIIQSYPGLTNWNAIDPNLITDQKGNPYLAFGSFWDGLKLVKLSKNRLKVIGDTVKLRTIASRKKDTSAVNPPSVDNNPPDAGGNAIEAPFIFRKAKYFYLFASIDYCCKGPESTYKMIIGRSKSLQGPYLDEKGLDLRHAGGTILLQGDQDWYGVGHNAVLSTDGKDYLVYHGYDAHDEGRPKLQIRELVWAADGWPRPVKH
jgi:arabinan endo-1,5-alpha-L-arabinosidase